MNNIHIKYTLFTGLLIFLTWSCQPPTPVRQQVSQPVISLASGTYNSDQAVVISTSTADAAIYYTTDGSVPTTSAVRYTAPVIVDRSMVLSAKAFRSGWDDSVTASAQFVIRKTLAAPSFSVPAGKFSQSQSIVISSSTPGAAIYYTLDGSSPDLGSGLEYVAPVVISKTSTLKAMAVKTDWDDSPVASAAYVILGTGEISVEDYWKPTISLTGHISELNYSVEMTVTASVSPLPDTYAWYLDGEVINGASSSSVTFGSTLTPGTHVLTLIVSKGTLNYSEQVNFTVIAKGGADITIHNPLSPSILFSGHSGTLSSGSTMTVTAEADPVPDSYQWYLDGELVSGAVSDQITVGSGLTLGSHMLTVVLRYGTSLFSVSLNFTVSTNSGTISGRVVDGFLQTAVEGVQVQVKAGTAVLADGTTESDGTFILTVPAGTGYTVVLTKTGYLTANYAGVNAVDAQTTYLQSVLYIESTYSGTGNVSGVITDAFDGSGVSNATVNLYSGLNDTSQSVVATAETTTSGSYSFTGISGGYYTAEVIKVGYTTATFNLIVLGTLTLNNQNFSITPLISSSQIRVVLTWGASPYDLDSHMKTPGGEHIYYSSQGYTASAPYTALDYDDTSSYGPETVTIYQQETGDYVYYVHDYSNRSSTSSYAMAESGAVVKLYIGAALVATFNVPYQAGTLWKVFSINGTSVTPINTMLNESSPGNVSSRNLPVRNQEYSDLVGSLPQKAGK